MSGKQYTDKIKIILQAAGIMLIGIYSMFCIHFHRYFAKLHVTIPGTELPLFVGEMLFGVCIVLLISLWTVSATKFNKWYSFLFIGLSFVIFKVFYGYYQWGTLALRHAALFYYPLFAVITYNFYNSKFFNQIIVVILLLIFLMNRLLGGFFDYYILTYLCLVLVFALKIQNRLIKYTGLLIIFITLPYNFFFGSCRTIIIGNFVALFFIVIVYCLRFIPVRRQYQWGLFILCLLISGLGILKSVDKNALKSMFFWNSLITEYNQLDGVYKAKAGSYTFRNSTVKLYKQESDSVVTVASKNLEKWRRKVLLAREKIIAQALTVTQEQMPTAVDGSNSYSSQELAIPTETEDTVQQDRQLGGAINSAIWRIFLWQDIFKDLFEQRGFLGVDFGKPIRSKKVAVIGWGAESDRTGWEEPHNSYIHILYRSGLVGVILIGFLLFSVYRMAQKVILGKSLKGVFLVTIVIFWVFTANFGVILEVPYYAVPFWSLFGLIYRYCSIQQKT